VSRCSIWRTGHAVDVAEPHPKGLIYLDFNIRSDQPGAFDEWEARAQWLGLVVTHGEALAEVAVGLATAEFCDRVKLLADRLGTR
jgi:hypothetical protein